MSNPALISHRIRGLEIKGVGQVFNVQDTSPSVPFNLFVINTAERKARLQGTFYTNVLVIDNPPLPPPAGTLIWVYDDDAELESQVLIEQKGVGDATLCFKLSAGPTYAMGIDNSQANDAFKISKNATLGTTDVFLIDTTASNVALGENALSLVNGGTDNIAIGDLSLDANVAGIQNIAIGTSALGATTGSENVAIGYDSMVNNISGSKNVSLGNFSLVENNTGTCNTCIGYYAGNTFDSSFNTIVGYNSTRDSATGTYNSALGFESMRESSTINHCVALGAYAMRQNNADENTAVGTHASRENTTGVGNVSVGFEALRLNDTPSNNTAIGHKALATNIGASNTALGSGTLLILDTGTNNIAIGHNAGSALDGGDSNNIHIGNIGVDNDSGIIKLGTTATHICTTLVGAQSWLDNQGFTPSTGGTVTPLSTSSVVIIIPDADPIATLTLNMPASPKDGQFIKIVITTSITTLTHNGNGATLVGPFQAGIAGPASGTWYYESTADAWYPVGHPVEGDAGNVVGTPVTTTNALARYTDATGLLIKNSMLILDDNTHMSKGAVNFIHERGAAGNFAAGSLALNIVTGSNNTGLGQNALSLVVGGGNNVAVGFNALLANTATGNTAVGYNALPAVTAGTGCAAVGLNSLLLATGSNNTAMGSGSLSAVVAGTDNVALGKDAGISLTGTDSKNILIGNTGTVGDNEKIRIGNTTDHNASFLLGGLLASDITAAGVGAGAGDFTISSTNGSMILRGGEAISDAVQITSTHSSGGVTLNTGSGGVNFPRGTIAQAGALTNGVTLNLSSGIISTINTSLAALGTAVFTVINNRVVAGSVITVSIVSYTGTYFTNGLPVVNIDAIAGGSFDIRIINYHAANILSGIVQISFIVV